MGMEYNLGRHFEERRTYMHLPQMSVKGWERRATTRRFALEGLESRTVLSANLHAAAILGTIGGAVPNAAPGAGVNHVRIQLVNPHGAVAQQTFTNALGQYNFKISRVAPFVV